jgi:hypothetical protein
VLYPVICDISPKIVVEIRLFVTGANERDDDSIVDDVEFKTRIQSGNKSVLKVLTSPVVRVEQGRPDLDGLVKEKIARAAGDISVNGMILI